MDQFLKNHKALKFSQHEINDLNSSELLKKFSVWAPGRSSPVHTRLESWQVWMQEVCKEQSVYAWVLQSGNQAHWTWLQAQGIVLIVLSIGRNLWDTHKAKRVLKYFNAWFKSPWKRNLQSHMVPLENYTKHLKKD